MEYTMIDYEVQDGMAVITLQRSEAYNSFNKQLCTECLHALERSNGDEAVKVVVMLGAGKAFSGGGDIKEMYDALQREETDTIRQMADLVFRITLAIKSMKKLVLMGVQGPVAGAAFNMVLGADLCIAAESSTFIQAFVKIGLVPDAGGMYLLTRSLGVNKAMQLAIMGDTVSAVEGKELGFVYRIVPNDRLQEEVLALGRELVKGPHQAYGHMKELVWHSEFKDFPDYGAIETKTQGDLGKTEDYAEGIRSFMEKRKPTFQGK